jgi:hypothetical protein
MKYMCTRYIRKADVQWIRLENRVIFIPSARISKYDYGALDGSPV